jgi:hypothetical protein
MAATLWIFKHPGTDGKPDVVRTCAQEPIGPNFPMNNGKTVSVATIGSGVHLQTVVGLLSQLSSPMLGAQGDEVVLRIDITDFTGPI